MEFRKKWGINMSYKKQGLIFFVCINYNIMPNHIQRKILNVCTETAGEYHQALFELITTDKSVTEVSIGHYVSPETLYRLLRKFYVNFEADILNRAR